jgi:hypothetical protein
VAAKSDATKKIVVMGALMDERKAIGWRQHAWRIADSLTILIYGTEFYYNIILPM